MLNKPVFKLFSYLNPKNLKVNYHKLSSANPALALFVSVSVVGVVGILLYLFDGGIFNSGYFISVQEEKTYTYKAIELKGISGDTTGYKINFDKNSLKFNAVAKGGHSIEQFVEDTGACAAINANFYHTNGNQLGLYSNDYHKCENCPSRGFVDTLFMKASSRPQSVIAESSGYYFVQDVFWNTQTQLPAGVSNGIAGKLVIKDGVEQQLSTNANSYSYFGWDSAGELYAFSFYPSSASIHVKKMITEGIKYAIMLDGGGSSQMYSTKGTQSDTTKTNVIPKTRRVPYYIGSGDCGTGQGQPLVTSPVVSDKPQIECKTTKAGFNPGQTLPVLKGGDYYARLKQYGMNSILGIAEGLDGDSAAAIAFVETANANGVVPIIRFCVGGSSCDKYKDAQAMADFIREVSKAGKFAVILGPNEPNLEKWKGDDFYEIGRFTADVATRVQDLYQVELLSVVFDTAYHLNMSLKSNPDAQYPEIQKVGEYFSGLGDRQLLDGLALNAYNTDNVLASDRVDYFLSYLNTNGNGLGGNFSKVYITEFGYFKDKMPSLAQLKEAYTKLASKPEMAGILFFTPFSDLGNQDFPNHQLTGSEFAELLDISQECIDQNQQQPIITPVAGPIDPNSPIVGSGTIVNSKLEYCAKNGGSSYENCIPYARYYDEPKNELFSCQTDGIGEHNKEVKALVKVKYDQASNTYKGQGMLAARVKNFPMLRHFGNGSFGEGGYKTDKEDQLVPFSFEGTRFNPYQPICSFMSEIFPGNGTNLLLTHEYPGKIIFYDDFGSSYEYAMPTLGNGLSCLNLLSYLMPNAMASGDISKDFPAFTISNLTENERKVARCKSKQALQLQSGASYEKIMEIVKNDKYCAVDLDYGYNTFDFTEDNYSIYIDKGQGNVPITGKPYFYYSDSKKYCSDSGTYAGVPLKYLNRGSNFSSEAFRGPSQVVRLDNIEVKLDTECLKGDVAFLIKDAQGNSLKASICSSGVKTDAYVQISYPVPKTIGIPGGASAYSNLTEYLQKAAENKIGKVVTPANAVAVVSQFFVYPNNEVKEYELGDMIPDSYQRFLTPEQVQSNVTTAWYYMPYMDYQPLFVALQYVLNSENEKGIYDAN